ncbi:DUF6236 family protein [Flavobacterium sp. N2820]|uniref:DUF6236 family protein n=1 Tax=Flavobacterium sp. N2820 TaxID=2986834 RepID=UPI0022242A71|nr:DUF6236 family protein [Flavobacterium sp. N2820]
MTIPFGRALYYPHINFRDYNWLKYVALYYDGIDRIVPSDDLVEEIDFIQRLNDSSISSETQFVRNINPRGYADEIAHDFLVYAKAELCNKEKREEIYKKISHIVTPNDTYFVHTQKMGQELLRELPKLEIPIKEFSLEFENFIEFDAVTGAMYMSRLANCIATHKSLPIVSDDLNFQTIVREAQKDRNISDISETLATMVIQSVVPKNIENISTKKIIEFRNKYRDERQQFYLNINDLVKDLYKIEDEQSLKDALHFRKQHIERATKDIEGVFKSLKIDTSFAIMALSVPSFASGLGWAVAGAGLVAVAAGKLALKGIDYQKTKRNSPYSYILTMKNQLGNEELAESLLKGKILF